MYVVASRKRAGRFFNTEFVLSFFLIKKKIERKGKTFCFPQMSLE